MQLLFLHGPPSVGKHTIASAVLTQAGGRMFDNHAAIDFARTIFDFGAVGFWELVRSARVAALDHAARYEAGLIVTTACYDDSEDRPHFQTYLDLMDRHGARILPVYLHCSDEERIRRVSNPDRVTRGKVSSADGLARYEKGRHFTAVPHPDCIRLDTEQTHPDQTAAMIVDHFGLVRTLP